MQASSAIAQQIEANGAATRLLSEPEVAKFLGVSHECVRRWRYAGTGPRYVRLGDRLIRYELAAVQEWLRARGQG
jgi:predicted DNA-binding transcriptional regulator AlpA